MITYRTTTLTFLLSLFVMNMISIAWHAIPVLYYILLVVAYISVTLLFSFFIRSGFYIKAYCKKETKEKIIALTFDDGPDPGLTPRILDILKGTGKATFFCIGRKIDGNEQLIKRMETEGHLIGTHSYSHSNWFDLFSSTRMKKEFILTDQKIFGITGKKPLLFRPPYGVINPTVKKALRSFRYHVIGFSNRAWDTSAKDEEKILDRLIRNLKPGDVVLLHDPVPQCIPALERFLKFLEKNEFTVVGIDELFNIQPYA